MKGSDFNEFKRLVGLLHDGKYEYTVQGKYDGYVLNISLYGEYAVTVEKHGRCVSGKNERMDVYSICAVDHCKTPRTMTVDEIMCLLHRYKESLLFRMRQQYTYTYKTVLTESADGAFSLECQSKFLNCGLTEDMNGYIEGFIKVYDKPLTRRESAVLYGTGDAESKTYPPEEIEKMFSLAHKRSVRDINRNNTK